jgi:hypothetical protein
MSKGNNVSNPKHPLIWVAVVLALAVSQHLFRRTSNSVLAAPPASLAPAFVEGESAAKFPSLTLVRAEEPRASQSANQLDLLNRELIVNCLRDQQTFRGVTSAKEFSNLTEYFSKAVMREPTDANVLYRNLHLVNRMGQNLRLHITPSQSGAGTAKFEVRLFSTDDENLPVPMPLPPELKDLDINQAVETFKSQGQLTLDETSESQKWDEGLSAHVLRRSDRIEKLEVYFPGGALVCANTCRCL